MDRHLMERHLMERHLISNMDLRDADGEANHYCVFVFLLLSFQLLEFLPTVRRDTMLVQWWVGSRRVAEANHQ